MSSPQVENGYLRIATELAEALSRVNLSPYEWRVLWFVMRKTYGFNKAIDRIPLSQFVAGIGIDERNVRRAIKTLEAKRMLKVDKDNPSQLKYGPQKDYSQWIQPRSVQTRSVETQNPVCTDRENPVSRDRLNRQKTYSKDNSHLFPAVETIIHRLNALSGKSYQCSKTSTENLCARLREGVTEADCIAVLEDRWQRWGRKPEMKEHFNPVTLFRPKNFERYLTEARANGSANQGEFVG